MRNRFSIALALGVLLAVLTAGVVSAQSVGVNGSGVTVQVPGGPTVSTPQVLPACSNTADDDGDGLVDSADPGCSGGPSDGDETNAATPTTTTPSTTQPSTTQPSTTTSTPDPTTTTPEQNAEGGKGGSNSSTDFDPPEDKGGKKDEGRDHSFGQDEEQADESDDSREPFVKPDIRRPDGAPTDANPTVSITDVGAAPVGVPNFIIDQFSIPPFLLPIYQACGTQYGIPWEVLASINRIETAFGTNLNVSTAGALGWMQFIPSTWEMYGVDANNDGRKDPYNPVDAICAAARYLKAAGGQDDLYQAIYAYNHADWYVDEVLLYAKQYGKLPSPIVDSLTGLTEGAHFPVAAKARYADDISEREAAKRASSGGGTGNVADVISDSPTRRGIDIYAKQDAPVVAVNDGVITDVGSNKKLGKYIVLRDAYGNEFTYAGLGSISKVVPVPQERKLSSKDFDLVTPGEGDAKPQIEASDTSRDKAAKIEDDPQAKGEEKKDASPKAAATGEDHSGPVNTEDSRQRLFAKPRRKANVDRASLTGQLDSMLDKGVPGYETFKSYFSGVLRFDDSKMDTAPLRKGSHVIGGTILGRVAPDTDAAASHVNFAITPAGRGAHTIDPKPILDGWKLLEATAIYRAAGKNPFNQGANAGQVLLESKAQLQQQVLNDPNIEIYSCGRSDIQTGQIDRRILATMEYLVARGFDLTITSLKCGHSISTTSGNISEHSTGDAMDIAQVNGIPILGNQGRGSITEAVINELLKLQGPMQPHQIISLMEMGGPTFAMADHNDHIHVGFTPDATTAGGQPLNETMLSPSQWDKLLDRIGELDQPTVPTKPSKYSLPAHKNDRASNAHIGE
jgi:hypothetical protein